MMIYVHRKLSDPFPIEYNGTSQNNISKEPCRLYFESYESNSKYTKHNPLRPLNESNDQYPYNPIPPLQYDNTHPLLVSRIPLEELPLLPLMSQLQRIVLLLHLDRLGLIPSILPGHGDPRRALRPSLDDHLLQNEFRAGADDVELLEEGAAQVGVREAAG